MRVSGLNRRGWLLLAASTLAAAAALVGVHFADRPAPARPEGGTTISLTGGTPLIGVLVDDSTGGHFCSASVVHSPHRNLAVTAAHCVAGGEGFSFAPGFHEGARPYGTWPVARVVVDPAWTAESDPDVDVGFLVLDGQGGRQIEDVVGANQLGTDRGFTNQTRMTGTPDELDTPLTCAAPSRKHSAHQLAIDCPGFTDGTSGGPWVIDADPSTGLGTLVGVIGGFEEGGGTAGVSYSTYFDHRIGDLYQRATEISADH